MSLGAGTRARLRVRPEAPVGAVSPWLLGQFSEHLHDVVHGGLDAELLRHRKFEMPGVRGRLEPVAPAWEAVASPGAVLRRGDSPYSLAIGPDCHHHQIVDFPAARAGGHAGILQRGIPLDAGTRYEASVRCTVVGAVAQVRLSLLDGAGTAIASADVDIPEAARITGLDRPERLGGETLTAFLVSPTTLDDGGFAVTADPPAGADASLWIHAVSLRPADHAGGLHRGTLDALRALPVSIVKYPGGCFADNYDWRLGIGPRDRRHGAPDYAWGTWDENDFGTDEFLRWCELAGATPYLCTNHGSGSPELAAAWVEYCNGAVDTEWGARRAENGHPEPYRVALWAIGNETFGFWERGAAPPEIYAQNVRDFADAMRAVDPTVRIVAQGDTREYGRAVLELCGSDIDYLSVHHYSTVHDPSGDIAGYLQQGRGFEEAVGRVAEAIRTTPGAEHVRICLDEWGWTHAAAAPVSTVYCALVLNACSRLAPYVAMGGHCCIANPMGVVERRGERVVRTRMYDLFHLYDRLFGDVALRVEGLPEALDGIAYGRHARGTTLLLASTSPEPQAVDVEGVGRDRWEVTRIDAQGASTETLDAGTLHVGPFEVVGVAPAGAR